MQEPYLVDKPLGATPLEALGMLRSAEPSLADAKLAYAGRLDPMATGLLVVLHGPLLARQEEFWALDKEYEATFLLGVQTDSHDLLGICTRADATTASHERILTTAAGMVGKHILPVPLLSSAVVDGKPLFAWARQGAAPQPPCRRMVVKQWDVHEVVPMDAAQVAAAAAAGIPRVRGDFRQEETMARWGQVCAAGGAWTAMRSRIACGSGTYIRSLAHELGRRLGSGAMVLDLRRTRVGPWPVAHARSLP